MKRLLPLLLVAGCATTPNPLQTSCESQGFAYDVLPRVGMTGEQVACATATPGWENWRHTTMEGMYGKTRVYTGFSGYSFHVNDNDVVTAVFDY